MQILITEGSRLKPFRVTFNHKELTAHLSLTVVVSNQDAFAVFSIYKYINICAVLVCIVRFYKKVRESEKFKKFRFECFNVKI